MSTVAAVDWSAGLESGWSEVAGFVPQLLAFLLILVVGYLIAKALVKALDVVLERVGFDRAVERGGVRKALAKSQYDASDLLGRFLFFAVMLFVLEAAFNCFGPNPISALLTSVIAYLPNVFVALVIVVVAASIAAAVREVVEASIGGLSYGKSLANAAALAILALGFFAALNQLHIAEDIVNGLYYAAIIAIVGVSVVSVGGGGIQPMEARWERWLSLLADETENVKRESAGASERISARAQSGASQAGAEQGEDTGSRSSTSPPSGRTPQGF